MVDRKQESEWSGGKDSAEDEETLPVEADEEGWVGRGTREGFREGVLESRPTTAGGDTRQDKSKNKGEEGSIEAELQEVGEIDAEDLGAGGAKGTIEGDAEGALGDEVGGGKSKNKDSGDE